MSLVLLFKKKKTLFGARMLKNIKKSGKTHKTSIRHLRFAGFCAFLSPFKVGFHHGQFTGYL